MMSDPSPSKPDLQCWCGSTPLEDFCSSHHRCTVCGTLISSEMRNAAHYATVGEEETGFYGARYWTDHNTRTLGLPSLEDRARSDLTERAIDWMCRILELRQPPAAILELGCAHARLVLLLQRAGFDAEGMEMSPEIVRRARELSGVTVHVGPLESASVRSSYDIIAAMDVLEHLVDPLATLRACRELLPDDGLLVLQTPCHHDPDENLEMLIPEHLHLFNGDGIRRLLERAGFAELEVDTGFFPYDMWIVASPRGPIRHTENPTAGLEPLLVALIDGLTERKRIQRDLDWSEKVRKELQAELDCLSDGARTPEEDSRHRSVVSRLRRLLGRRR